MTAMLSYIAYVYCLYPLQFLGECFSDHLLLCTSVVQNIGF